MSVEVSKSDDDYLVGSDGTRYIDFAAGWCVGNVGWSKEEIKRVLREFDGPEYVRPPYVYKGWIDLAKLLADITPRGLAKSFRATGGTEAVEIAMQAAMSYTKRHKFISIEGAYHGHSIGAMSIGSSDFRSWYKNLLPDCYKIKPPLDSNTVKEVEELLKQEDIAAFISEPIICNLGVEIPSPDFLPSVQELCRKHGTVFIMDEVATGFGRTGKMFASEHFDLEPDIICLAKGISGGYGALGAAVMTEKLAEAMKFSFSFYSTYGWHPLNVAGAIAVIKYLTSHQEEIFANAERLSNYFSERLKAMSFRSPVEIRIKGLAIGLKFGDTKYAGEVFENATKKKLLIGETSDSSALAMFPALTMSQATAKEGLDIFESII